jgi:hypothetical protein
MYNFKKFKQTISGVEHTFIPAFYWEMMPTPSIPDEWFDFVKDLKKSALPNATETIEQKYNILYYIDQGCFSKRSNDMNKRFKTLVHKYKKYYIGPNIK